MITVGTDTYITIEQANEYVVSHFVSTDAQRIAWESLQNDDKEVYLRKATEQIESIRYTGVCKDSGQALSFPRCFEMINRHFKNENYFDFKFRNGLYCQADVPDSVKNAQAEEALEMASPTSDTDSYNAYAGHVENYSVIGLSEKYRNPQDAMDYILHSKKAKMLLKNFVGGGYRVV